MPNPEFAHLDKAGTESPIPSTSSSETDADADSIGATIAVAAVFLLGFIVYLAHWCGSIHHTLELGYFEEPKSAGIFPAYYNGIWNVITPTQNDSEIMCSVLSRMLGRTVVRGGSLKSWTGKAVDSSVTLELHPGYLWMEKKTGGCCGNCAKSDTYAMLLKDITFIELDQGVRMKYLAWAMMALIMGVLSAASDVIVGLIGGLLLFLMFGLCFLCKTTQTINIGTRPGGGENGDINPLGDDSPFWCQFSPMSNDAADILSQIRAAQQAERDGQAFESQMVSHDGSDTSPFDSEFAIEDDSTADGCSPESKLLCQKAILVVLTLVVFVGFLAGLDYAIGGDGVKLGLVLVCFVVTLVRTVLLFCGASSSATIGISGSPQMQNISESLMDEDDGGAGSVQDTARGGANCPCSLVNLEKDFWILVWSSVVMLIVFECADSLKRSTRTNSAFSPSENWSAGVAVLMWHVLVLYKTKFAKKKSDKREGEQYTVTARAVVKRAKALNSKRVGHLEEGQVITALDKATVSNSAGGANITRIKFEDAGLRGWVSTHTKQGDELMSMVENPSAESEGEALEMPQMALDAPSLVDFTADSAFADVGLESTLDPRLAKLVTKLEVLTVTTRVVLLVDGFSVVQFGYFMDSTALTLLSCVFFMAWLVQPIIALYAARNQPMVLAQLGCSTAAIFFNIWSWTVFPGVAFAAVAIYFARRDSAARVQPRQTQARKSDGLASSDRRPVLTYFVLFIVASSRFASVRFCFWRCYSPCRRRSTLLLRRQLLPL